MDEHRRTDPALRIALAWQPLATRPALAALFELDQRLSAMVHDAKEPMLAQIRLAWWREQIGQGLRTHGGEPLLSRIEQQWGEHAPRLASLVDGWENLLDSEPSSPRVIDAFAAGRAEALAAFADLVDAGAERAGAFAAGRCWALAEFSSRTSSSEERDSASSLAARAEFLPVRSRSLRGVSVLGGLARRALDRGEPILHGRGAVLAAIRLGMFAR